MNTKIALGLCGVAAGIFLTSVGVVWFSHSDQKLDRLEDMDRTHIGGSLMLDASELASTKRLAENGDGEAAYLVYQHYSIGLGDPSRAKSWLEKSFAAGYPAAIEAVKVLESINR